MDTLAAFRAPELILQSGYDSKIDIWAVGCLVSRQSPSKAVLAGSFTHDHIIRLLNYSRVRNILTHSFKTTRPVRTGSIWLVWLLCQIRLFQQR